MDDAFKIFVEQLRKGHVEKLDETLASDFLDVREDELSFPEPVKLKGEAYLADENLVFHFDASCVAQIPCAICNQPVRQPIAIQNHYIHVPLAEVKSGVYHFRDDLREAILLEVPLFVECQEGKCPERKNIAKYLKPPSSQKDEEEGYKPFADKL